MESNWDGDDGDPAHGNKCCETPVGMQKKCGMNKHFTVRLMHCRASLLDAESCTGSQIYPHPYVTLRSSDLTGQKWAWEREIEREMDGRTDGQTDRQTDRKEERERESSIYSHPYRDGMPITICPSHICPMARVLKGFHSFTCTTTRSSAIGMSHTCL